MKETIEAACTQMEKDAKRFADSLGEVSGFTKQIAETAYLAGEKFIASKILNAIPREPSAKEIDWEQRRYEIAKAAMVGELASPVVEGIDPNPSMDEVVKWSVMFADKLIAELKKTSK